jgi:hypothetical protein
MNRVLLVVVAVGSALIGAAICWLVMRTDRLVVPMPSVPSAEADRPRTGEPIGPTPEDRIHPQSIVEPAEEQIPTRATTQPAERLSQEDAHLIARVARFMGRDVAATMSSIRPGADLADLRKTFEREQAEAQQFDHKRWDRAAILLEECKKAGRAESYLLAESKDRESLLRDEEERQPRSTDEFVISGVERDEATGRVKRTLVRILPGQDREFDRISGSYRDAIHRASPAILASLAQCQR